MPRKRLGTLTIFSEYDTRFKKYESKFISYLSILVLSFLRFFRPYRFIDAYRRGMNGRPWQAATYANKKYCGHRVIPKTISKDLDDDSIHKYEVSTTFLHYNQCNSSISLKSLDAAWACRACHMHVTCTWCFWIGAWHCMPVSPTLPCFGTACGHLQGISDPEIRTKTVKILQLRNTFLKRNTWSSKRPKKTPNPKSGSVGSIFLYCLRSLFI